jgi:hypothetical protein
MSNAKSSNDYDIPFHDAVASEADASWQHVTLVFKALVLHKMMMNKNPLSMKSSKTHTI